MSDRIHRRIHRINSNVYARGDGGEDGMFTRRNVKRGDILCSYTGTQVPEDAADPHNTQYLMHMLRRRRHDDGEEEVIVTIDGRGELGGYANSADNTVANATVADVIRTVQEMNTGAGNALDVAMIVVATVDIPAGREVRWDYDHTQDRPFRAAMLRRGITADELDSDAYATVEWAMADDVVMPGVDMDFPYATIDELSLRITTMRGRKVVTEKRRGGRKRRHGESAMAADEMPEADDAPT